ncbi:MAG TPA: ATP-binding protein [Thermodesulfovibrionales bacterium]|nr:ATP-binding protein [Thermodesulfovibrionales bacterium]
MEDISLHILDIAENSVSASATLVRISITDDPGKNLFTVTIEDNGRGMDAVFVRRVLDPFCTTRTERNVGLGLSFLAQAARETGGDIRIQSVVGQGTIVRADFRPAHIDMKPLGNITDTIVTLIAGNPRVDFHFSYARAGNTYSLDTREIRSALEDVPINSADVLSAIRSDLSEGLQAVKEANNVPL